MTTSEQEEFDSLDVEEQEAEEELEDEEQRYEHWRMLVDAGQAAVRVDKFLMDHMPQTSRTRIQKAAEAGCIEVDGHPVRSNYKVKGGDVVTLMLGRPKRDWHVEAEDIPLDVVYEDSDLMVVDKPAGMVVHPGCGNFTGTMVNAVAWHLKDEPGFDINDPSVGLVHRIDKDTSGLLVVAKKAETKSSLAKQFFDHSSRRSYEALVWGDFPQDEGRIEGNIGRDPRERQRMTVFPAGSDIGKAAVTHYEVKERFGHVTLITCRLETGRTHQIRAHMKHIGHPLFGDQRYGGDQILWGERTSSYKAFIGNCLKVCPRQALHAATLGFTHPRSGEEMLFTSGMPLDMRTLIEKWRRRQ